MPHLALDFIPTSINRPASRACWREIRRVLRQGLNLVVRVPPSGGPNLPHQLRRNIYRFIQKEGLPCVVTLKDNNILVLHL